MNDKHLLWGLAVLLLVPIGFSMVSKESFRYPCQDPANWESAQCQKPLCDVTRTCPEHIFKGQRDPRLGPPTEQEKQQSAPVKVPAPTGGCK